MPSAPSRSAALSALLTALAVLLSASCGNGSQTSSTEQTDPRATGEPPARIEVRIDGLVIDAEVARTPEERQLGLGGRDSLPRDQGMLFVFEEEGRRTFWMRGMRFPLDFVWIGGDGRVVELTENVPPPEPGTPDSELDRFGPGAPVRYVLEVNVGVVREGGIDVGDMVTFEPPP